MKTYQSITLSVFLLFSLSICTANELNNYKLEKISYIKDMEVTNNSDQKIDYEAAKQSINLDHLEHVKPTNLSQIALGLALYAGMMNGTPKIVSSSIPDNK